MVLDHSHPDEKGDIGKYVESLEKDLLMVHILLLIGTHRLNMSDSTCTKEEKAEKEIVDTGGLNRTVHSLEVYSCISDQRPAFLKSISRCFFLSGKESFPGKIRIAMSYPNARLRL